MDQLEPRAWLRPDDPRGCAWYAVPQERHRPLASVQTLGQHAPIISLWLGAYDQGLAYAGLAPGTYFTLRILNFADLTVDGAFALGGGTAAVLISQGVPAPLALLAAVVCGALAGAVTALIHTRLGVNDLFAGILTTTGL